jgi:hypothetical protein
MSATSPTPPTIAVSGDVNFTGIAVTPGTSTLIMNGNGNTLTPSGQTLNNFEMANNTTLGGDLSLNDNLKIDSGKTFDATNRTLNIAGDFNNAGGTLTSTGSTVNLTGADSSNQNVHGSTTFNNLSVSTASNTTGRMITFDSLSTQTIAGTLTLTGGADLALRSSSPGQQWNITPNGSRTVSYVDVQDSDNTVAGTPIIASNSHDSGDNTNWTISAGVPNVRVSAVTNLAPTSATLNGNITSTGGVNPTERGFKVYAGAVCAGGILQNPHDTGSYGTGAFSKPTDIALDPNTIYSYTAYAINLNGTGTSSCQSFTTENTLGVIHSLSEYGMTGEGGDDTAVFQAALNAASGQNWTLYIPVPPISPYLVNPLFVQSNTTLLFAPGVVIKAAPGYGGDDCLLSITNVTNVTIIGYGATLTMPKAEYTSGEMRHTLNIRGATNVTVEGLSCNDSGGDGIYIGEGSPKNYSENVTIQDVTCNNNRRQGMSIISAQNLLVSHSNFTNTNGTAPQDGIDIEPNHSTNRLVNVRIENCVTSGNAGDGIQVYLNTMDGTSLPVSIAVTDHIDTSPAGNGCYIAGNDKANPVTGAVTFTNFTSHSAPKMGVYVSGWDAGGASVTFSNLTVTNPDQLGPTHDDTAIFIDQPLGSLNPGGNIFIPSSTISGSSSDMYYYFDVKDESGLGYQHLQIGHGAWSGALYDPYGRYLGTQVTNVNTDQPGWVAGNKVWDGGGGADTNWSTCANWSGDTCPQSGDNVVFNSTSTHNSTIDAGFAGTIGSFTIGAGYSGTITLSRSLTVANDFSSEAGTFNAGAQTISVGGNWSYVGGTFTASTSTVNFNATATGNAVTSGGQSFNNLTFNGAGGGWTLDDDILVGNNLTVSAGTLTGGSAIITVSGNVDFTGGGLTAGTSTLVMNGSGKTLTPSAQTLNNFEVANNTTLGGDLSLNGYLKIDSGKNFDATTRTLNIAGDFNNAGGTLTSTGSTVNLTGTDGSNQLVHGSISFSNLAISTAGNTTGRTITFDGSSTQIVVGTWTVTGASGKILNLQSSNGNNWTINPTAATASYVNVSHSTNSGVAFCASYSSHDTPNTTTGWQISSGATCAPAASPSSFSGAPASSISINWSWLDNADNENNYQVQNAAHANISGDLAANTTSYLETGLSANTQYLRHATALNDFGNTDSNSDTKFTLADPPGSATATALSSSSIQANWSAGGAQSKFDVYRNGQSGVGTLVYTGPATTYTDTALNSTTSYTYDVYAVNGDNVETPSFSAVTVSTTSPASAVTTDHTSPSASFTITQNLTNLGVGQFINFDASGSTDNLKVTGYLWNFGDGTTSKLAKIAHQFLKPGRYLVTLTVFDAAGNSSTKTQTLDIKPPVPQVTNVTSQGSDLLVEGTAFPGTTLYLTFDTNVISGQTTVDSKGNWRYTFTNASYILGQGNHTVSAISAVKLADHTEIRSNASPTYHFKITLNNGTFMAALEKNKIWQDIALGLSLGLVLFMAIGLILKYRKANNGVSAPWAGVH